MRKIIRFVIVGLGVVLLALTFKTDLVASPVGYIIGAVLLASYFFGKEIGMLTLMGGVGIMALEFFNIHIDALRILRIPALKGIPFMDSGYVQGGILAIVGLVLIWFGRGLTQYYCDQCDQFLGTSFRQCPRCGSNRYRTESVD